MSWEECRKDTQMCRNGISKAKAQLELSLARDAKNKDFYFIVQKRKIKENGAVLTGEQATTNID